MCGIAGFVGHNAEHFADRLDGMLEIQAHRGPDARSKKIFNNCVLGHVRLSIIDLSSQANQPFCSQNGRWTIVYNGEIYNYIEVRQELEKQGTLFRTTSDTEVLVEAWAVWGEACLSRFIGMFAFALWDGKDRTLTCVRDRFGIKPFHYSDTGEGFVFSSELKGLFVAGVPREPDAAAWATFLRQGHYDHSEHTFFKDIKRLQPGYLLKVRAGCKPTIKRYWQLPVPFLRQDKSLTFSDACEELRSIILDTVQLHLRSDVPLGLLLSGGVDSAVVLAATHQAGKVDVEGFHHYFPDPYSELPWVREMVAAYGTQMHYYELLPERVEDEFLSFTWHMEEPFGSLVLLALGPLYALGRQRNMKVMLDGNGSDDIFGGYQLHHTAYLADMLSSGQEKKFQTELKLASAHWNVPENQFVQKIGVLEADQGFKTGPDLTLPVVTEVLTSATMNTPTIPLVVSGNCHSLLSQLIELGLTQTKIPRNTRFDDHVSMAYSFEQRVPMLDHRFCDFISRIPPDFLFQNGCTKSIFRHSMKGLVPDKILFAPKRHIQSPQREWLGKPLEKFVKSLIHSKTFGERGYVEPQKAAEYYEHYINDKPDNSFALWQWINLELWHRQFIDTSLDEIKERPTMPTPT